ncbi:RHS repeat domain-containing protein [Flavobacterium piscinae]|uniref:RHS repeat domain-containing protein n=1 Tax=Flavobacterium piscinae TaxID=2506424 RepID=UPI002AABEAB1|nr:RHS repeat-associated core domain-containing protein [Flavobacterium piscinae]
MFAFKLNYNTLLFPSWGGSALHNGNISESFWRTANDNTMRQYTYSYDGLNRLILANYRKPESSIYNSGSYNEAINYDKNGNIESLQRNGEYDDINQNLVIDDLVYTYSTISPNQLLKVEDNTNNPNGFKDGTNTGNDYTYDANGNMTADHNKGITAIKYNHLNLPTQITFATSGNISYIYNATGVKVRKVATEGSTVTTTDYLTGFQYINNKLEFFPHAEGYVKNVIDEDTGFGTTNNIYRYVFNYTDHLGNVRLTYTKHPITNVLTILEENNYYPFGLKHRNYNMNKKDYEKLAGTGGIEITPTNLTIYDYKYNGKEWQDELGLNFYDFGARNYDPAIGRWMNIDPLAEKYRRWSNYNYCMNNPVYFIDPDGMQIDLSAAKKNMTKRMKLKLWMR